MSDTSFDMEPHKKSTTSLFDVYLRLRPHHGAPSERFLDVDIPEEPAADPTHITITPPSSEYRKRAVEKFGFTKVFNEAATQRDVFNGSALLSQIDGVLAADGGPGRDGLVATLGVTGSGKSHTILGSKTQRGLIQMTLDTLYRSISANVASSMDVAHELMAADVTESLLQPAPQFLQSMYPDAADSRMTSRAQTPLLETTGNPFLPYPTLPSTPSAGSRKGTGMPQLTSLPQAPNLSDIVVAADKEAEYTVVISMYEVYNDRIFDLLAGSPPSTTKVQPKDIRRRPLLFKSTEHSPDRKVVTGLRKVVCSTLEEALLVLETGVQVRTVAGTGSNAVSSRSHGFICLEVKKKPRGLRAPWASNTLTIVDLAGSERARNAKTAGATLAEAGKINESLMYLGQCMQMQSTNSHNLAEQLNSLSNVSAAAISNPKLVPFRQCKLTELLFSNSFSGGRSGATSQKAIMIVTADACGDYSATYQILRYSTLAREVTVPRIPSVTSTIGLQTPSLQAQQPSSTFSATMSSTTQVNSSGSEYSFAHSSAVSATIEAQQMEIEALRIELAAARDDVQNRDDVLADMKASYEERLQEQEEELRTELADYYELELRKMRAAEVERFEEADLEREALMDSKIDILARSTKSFVIHEDTDEDDETTDVKAELARVKAQMVQLWAQNAALRNRLEGDRTPVRKTKSLKSKALWTERASDVDELGNESTMSFALEKENYGDLY